jgi:histidine triad (HIT) family protein
VSETCLFCDLGRLRAESVVFAENELAAFGNVENGESLSGSGVIVPKAHKPTVFDLDVDEIAATFALLREVRPLLERRYNPDGFQRRLELLRRCGPVDRARAPARARSLR